MKLAIGSANFGLNYGPGRGYQLPQHEINSILNFALENGIEAIDTSPNYGTSENRIGKSEANKKLKIFSKTPIFKSEQPKGEYKKKIKECFSKSLDNLKIDKLEGISIHKTNNLFNRNGYEIWETLLELKTEKLVNSIGVSIYPDIDCQQLINNIQPDFVQLPINVFDQRVIKNRVLEQLTAKKIKIHARSIFLQGLLGCKPNKIPNFLHALKQPIINFTDSIVPINLTPIQASLAFVKHLDSFEYSIVGMQTKDELNEIISSMKISLHDFDWERFSLSDEKYIDPRYWPKL